MLQAAATSEEPVKGVLGKGPGGQRRVLDQDSKQLSEQEYHASKRLKGAADDESSLAGQDADNEQEHLPAKRKRTPLFSMQDIIAAEKSNGECRTLYRRSTFVCQPTINYNYRYVAAQCLPWPHCTSTCLTIGP